MINWDRVTELRDEVGADDLIEIAEVFLDEMAEVLDPIRQGDLPVTPHEALHFLKGASLNIGFADLAAACAEMEQGRAVDYPALAVLFDASRTEFLAGLQVPA